MKLITVEEKSEGFSVLVDGKHVYGPATKDEAESYKNKLDKKNRNPKPPGDEDGFEP